MPQWQALLRHGASIGGEPMTRWFAEDPARVERFGLQAAGIFADFSKHRIDPAGMALLFELAHARGVTERRAAMFEGRRINATEHRAALHVALRAASNRVIEVDGTNVVQQVHAMLARMKEFCERVRAGDWRGFDGQPITDIVNIGIGGSDLGPAMACEALGAYGHPRLRTHFVSNVDGAHLARVLKGLQAGSTLFVVVSKTFTTQETLANARSARAWLLSQPGVAERDIARHFVAVSTHAREVSAFGIDAQNMFGFWDWVGGRFSLWSAVGLTLMLQIGPEGFDALLAGARSMDEHFERAPLEKSLPVWMALLGVWYRNVLGWGSHAVVPYAQDLGRLPAYLQQLEMESNGKSVTMDGAPMDVSTCPVIWGEPGTNGQHAFFQLLHQGTDPIPVDFIIARKAAWPMAGHQQLLIAHCLAQGAALMKGRSAEEAARQMRAAGLAPEEIAPLVAHRTFPGNRPSTTIVLPVLDPQALGALLALYEHKTFVQGVIWGVNSFDQWGVELGKQIAGRIEKALDMPASGETLIGPAWDPSTAALIERLRE